jgi:hypothetical protein
VGELTMAKRRKNPGDATGKIVTLVVVVGGGYFLYEWLKSQCSTVGSALYGNATLCPMLGLTVAASTVTTPTGGSSSSPVNTAAFWNSLVPQFGGTPLTPAQLASTFPNSSATMTMAQFTATVAAAYPSPGSVPLPSGAAPTPAPYVPPTTNPTPAAPTSNPSALTQQLLSAAGLGSSSTLNADQWSYYYTQTGHTAIASGTFESLFFPNGRPSDPTQNPQMTAAQFVAAIATAGLNGFGPVPQAVPTGWNPPIIWGRLPGGQLAGLGDDIGLPAYLIHGGTR